MKTAISIPSPLFRAADHLARRLRISRSKLYCSAVSKFIKQHSSEDITKRLDEIYSSMPDESKLAEPLARMQSQSLKENAW